MRFKLLAGMHEQADPNWKPTDEEKAKAKEEGVTLRPDRQRFRAGAVFEGPKDRAGNDVDLVERFGPEKFAYADGEKPKARAPVDGEVPPAEEHPPSPESRRPAPPLATTVPGVKVTEPHRGRK